MVVSRGRDEDELLELLERAVQASVLNESSTTPGRFYFSHALITHTLYEDLGGTRRARLHRRIAEALEEQLAHDPGGRVGELANHWAKATTAVDLVKAVGYARGWPGTGHSLSWPPTKPCNGSPVRWRCLQTGTIPRSAATCSSAWARRSG